ncbi:anti-sigma factor RsbA family regulatory protein [Streptomyces sp. SP18CS02]|uniref:anti-sigma factor RsbA family regulatory protein n=1 Tax=Streptomyces sp. SP18CS02 TaxID=3002531 RepID=UPI002E78E3F7|nr:anti-sigma factor RsbA family regulatory protein [Streptomyces sp. SP18CS02]MEE1757425.1 anti-sigma factor RsbA family regulatory protein [Streptomyces sp. SP18CS02]
MTGVAAQAEPFVHPALFYADEAAYLSGTVPFLEAGLAKDEPVAVAVPAANLALLRDALGRDAERVGLIDMEQAGRNPGRIIPRVLRAFADAHPGRHVRIIGEPIWQSRSAEEYPACVQHEALINHAFTGRTVTILCPYDTSRLDERVLTDARATHPVLIEGGVELPSQMYAPDRVVADYNLPLAVPRDVDGLDFDADLLPEARRYATRRALALGLPGNRHDDFALAVAELTTNSVVHGGGSGTVRVWVEGGHLVCEVRDRGLLDDPMAGRRPAAPGQIGGRGLLLVHYLSDLVRLHSGSEGTTVRSYFRCP